VKKSGANEPAEMVLAKARAAGFEVEKDDLRRWHREGLIPKPEQRWTEGVGGSQAIYPAGSGDQLCALCVIQAKNRSSAMNWGWKLWWLGFDVDGKYWRHKLRAQAKLIDRSSLELVSTLGDQDDDRYNAVVTALRTARTRNVPFRQLRRRLTARHFEGMVGLIFQILERSFRGWSFAPSDDADALRDRMMSERFFGFRRAKDSREMTLNPTMHDDVEAALFLLSRQLTKTTMTSVLQASSDRLIAECRIQLRVILFTVRGVNENAGLLAGYGVRVLRELEQHMTPGDQATLLLYLLALNRNLTFRKSLAVFLHGLRRHVPKMISDEEIDYLRSRDPAICSFAFPQ
jgi:hypothetical protein